MRNIIHDTGRRTVQRVKLTLLFLLITTSTAFAGEGGRRCTTEALSAAKGFLGNHLEGAVMVACRGDFDSNAFTLHMTQRMKPNILWLITIEGSYPSGQEFQIPLRRKDQIIDIITKVESSPWLQKIYQLSPDRFFINKMTFAHDHSGSTMTNVKISSTLLLTPEEGLQNPSVFHDGDLKLTDINEESLHIITKAWMKYADLYQANIHLSWKYHDTITLDLVIHDTTGDSVKLLGFCVPRGLDLLPLPLQDRMQREDVQDFVAKHAFVSSCVESTFYGPKEKAVAWFSFYGSNESINITSDKLVPVSDGRYTATGKDFEKTDYLAFKEKVEIDEAMAVYSPPISIIDRIGGALEKATSWFTMPFR